MLNISTGHYPKGGTSRVAGQVTALTFDASGKTLWTGDDKVRDFEQRLVKVWEDIVLDTFRNYTVSISIVWMKPITGNLQGIY